MSLVLQLPPELESQLAAEAAASGLSLNDYALKLLARPPQPQPEVTSGSELVAYWSQEGLIGTRSEITDAATHAREIRARSQTRLHS